MYSILLVEDDERLRHLVRDYLKRENYNIIESGNGNDAIMKFKDNKIDLIILDIMIPGMDGWSVCRKIRENSQVSIIMVTARSEEEDKLLGYELGADDYITKPFSPKVLVAKVKAVIKRIESTNKVEPSDKEYVEYDGLVIKELSHEVYLDENEITLSPKEYELLLYLVQNRGIALTRDKILDNVWGFDYYGDLRTVDTNIKRLREKLADKAYLISTIRGSGYKFEVKK